MWNLRVKPESSPEKLGGDPLNLNWVIPAEERRVIPYL